jgi:inorganic triphosphatase YgiF
MYGFIVRASREAGVVDTRVLRELYQTSLKRTRIAARVMIESAREMVSLNQEIVEQNSRDAIADVERTEAIIAWLAVIGILATVALRFFAVRTISRPLALLTAVSQKMAKGASSIWRSTSARRTRSASSRDPSRRWPGI